MTETASQQSEKVVASVSRPRIQSGWAVMSFEKKLNYFWLVYVIMRHTVKSDFPTKQQQYIQLYSSFVVTTVLDNTEKPDA